MALIRLAGNAFVVDSLSDRDSVPTTLPNGTTFRNLSTFILYILKDASWNAESIAVTGSSLTIKREFWTVTGNLPSGSIITIPNSTAYVTGSGQLNVYVDGLYQRINSGALNFRNDYYEQSSTTVRFSYALASGSQIGFNIYS